ncbi:MAG TPA: DNA-binding protein, partial [Amycolatopsis sp.]|nr:DNA-binding protein [Amycolatopsis sp.]
MPATSLADWLRCASDDELAALLQARRDLATPPPPDSTVLATRAGTAGSAARALEDLDTFTLAVLDALLVADADTEPAPLAVVADLVGADPRSALDQLKARAVAWGDEDALRVLPVTREIVGPFPAGLGTSVPELAGFDPAGLSEDERGVLSALAAGPPIGRSRDAAIEVTLEQATTPVQRLLARGLLRRRDQGTVELPREVALALRGGHTCSPGALHEPALPVNPHQQSTVDEAAAGEAMEFLRRMETL